jgi:hypothetical protein
MSWHQFQSAQWWLKRRNLSGNCTMFSCILSDLLYLPDINALPRLRDFTESWSLQLFQLVIINVNSTLCRRISLVFCLSTCRFGCRNWKSNQFTEPTFFIACSSLQCKNWRGPEGLCPQARPLFSILCLSWCQLGYGNWKCYYRDNCIFLIVPESTGVFHLLWMIGTIE